MRFLLALQCVLGVVKIIVAFTAGRKRMAWHLISGAVILGWGLVLLSQESRF